MSHHKKFTSCPNCGTNVEHANFCPNCGQENHDLHLPAGHLVLELLENTLHFDTKLWHSLKAIVTKPGKVTLDFIQGKRAYHIPPFRMYVFIAFVFFLLSTIFADRLVEDVQRATETQSTMQATESANKIQKRAKELPKVVQQKLWGELEKAKNEVKTFLPADQEHLADLLASEHKTLLSHWKPDSLRFAELPDSSRALMVASSDSTHARLKRLVAKSNENKILAAQGVVVETDSVSIPLVEGKKIAIAKARELLHASDEEINSFLHGYGLNPDALHRFALKTQIRWHEAKKKPKDLAHIAVKQLSYAMFFLMPFFALLLKLVYFYRGRYYYEHLIFAVHFHSVLFLFLILLLGVILWAENYTWTNTAVVVLWLGLLVYGFFAFYNVYEKPIPENPYPTVWQGFVRLTFYKKILLILGLILLSPAVFLFLLMTAFPFLFVIIGQWLFKMCNRIITFRFLPKDSKMVTVLATLGDREWIEDFFKYAVVLFVYINILLIAITIVTAISMGSVH